MQPELLYPRRSRFAPIINEGVCERTTDFQNFKKISKTFMVFKINKNYPFVKPF